LRLATHQPRHYVVIEDPLPAGLEPVDSRLKTSARRATPEDGALAAALDGGLATLEQAGASVVQATAIDGSWWRDVLVGQGFVAPRRANHLTIILHVHDGAHPLAAAARDPRGWYFTDGDRDDETMG